MYRKNDFLYMNRLSCIGKQLFVYMRGGTGIPGSIFSAPGARMIRRNATQITTPVYQRTNPSTAD
jgi:hypothetical protein